MFPVLAVFFNAVRATFAHHRMAQRSNEAQGMGQDCRRERRLPDSQWMPEMKLQGDGPQRVLLNVICPGPSPLIH